MGVILIPVTAHFDIPLDLPHAARIAGRLARRLHRLADELPEDPHCPILLAEELLQTLRPAELHGDGLPVERAQDLRRSAALLGRRLAAAIAIRGLAEDRLGQHIRNLFECLALGREGARLSLLAGENPDSLQRPV